MIKQEPNNKEKRRNRRQRNFVAKNNKHRAGYHTAAKYVRERWSYVPDGI